MTYSNCIKNNNKKFVLKNNTKNYLKLVFKYISLYITYSILFYTNLFFQIYEIYLYTSEKRIVVFNELNQLIFQLFYC